VGAIFLPLGSRVTQFWGIFEGGKGGSGERRMTSGAAKLSLSPGWAKTLKDAIELDSWGQREEARSLYERFVLHCTHPTLCCFHGIDEREETIVGIGVGPRNSPPPRLFPAAALQSCVTAIMQWAVQNPKRCAEIDCCRLAKSMVDQMADAMSESVGSRHQYAFAS